MAKLYTGGVVIGTPELTHGPTGTAKLLFKIRDEREAGGKVYVDEAVVEMWGDLAEQYAQAVSEGAVVKVQGFARADGRLADGKPVGVLVVKVGRVGDLEITRPATQAPARAQTVDDTDDPFADQ